jgi:ElaB/YqjD/DUF883 family membrane-anchored ribosome-binding protein
MAFKMKGYSAFTKKTDPPKKKYPKHYTKEDIKFLEEQNEDVVRKEDKVKPKKKKPKKKKKETSLERARRGLGLTREQLLEEQRKQREALKKYEEKYG